MDHPLYTIGQGHDVLDVNMVNIDPQPFGQPVIAVERNYGVGGTFYEQSSYILLHWDFIESPTAYQSLINQFNFDDGPVQPVTIHAQNASLYWRKYNGTAWLPEVNADMKRSNFFVRDINLYITDLEEIADA